MDRDQKVRADIRGVAACAVCGGPIVRVKARVPKTYCEDCRKFRSYLAAAERHLESIHFRDPSKARIIRSDLIAVANKLPVRWQRPRDERGRFRA